MPESVQNPGRDENGLHELYDQLSPALFGYLADMTNPVLAEDLLHEVWLKALAHLRAWPGPIRPWLFTVARNLAIDAHRTRRPQRSLEAEHSVADPSPDPDPQSEERATQLRIAIARLPETQREAVLLRHYSQLSLKQVAEILQVPLGTVASRLRSALETLREELCGEARQSI